LAILIGWLLVGNDRNVPFRWPTWWQFWWSVLEAWCGITAR